VSYPINEEVYDQLNITISSDRQSIEDISVIHEDLLNIPEEAKTDEHRQSLDNIRQYANEAVESSMIKELGVKTYAMPEQTNPVDGFRYCYVGECEMGNLYADALRWVEDADVGLLPSFMFDGPGWNEGEIRTLEILENLPYATSRCAGTMTGYSLLRILNHSLRTTSFDGFGSTKEGGILLQLSGLRVAYNHQLEGNQAVSVDVYDKNEGDFVPLELTRLYKFASCAHLCFTFTDFPPLFGELLDKKGEVQAFQSSDTDIKEDLKKYLASEFSNKIYEPKSEGRLVNSETRVDAIRLVEKEDCVEGKTYWSSNVFDCEPCPDFRGLQFSQKEIHLDGRAFAKHQISDKVRIANMEEYPIEVAIDKLALPDYMTLSVSSNSTDVMNTSRMTSPSYLLNPDSAISLELFFDPSERTAGTDTSTIVFTASPVPLLSNCPVKNVKLDIVATLSLSPDDNHIGSLAALGYCAAALVVVASFAFAFWVGIKRKTSVVSTMQPVFLITLCVGVLIMGSSLIPFSIDDQVASARGCDIACASRPWLLTVGCTLCIGALFAKLSRINKLFLSQSFRRMQVLAKDVIFLPSVLVMLNIIFNTVWTAVDPPRWERIHVKDQPYTSYGTCKLGEGTVGRAMFASIIAICGVGFFMTAWQAFLARNISSEFSESTYLGIAVYSWLQLGLVGIPVLLLIDNSNVSARYSLWVGIIFILCMSMLLVVFVPIMKVKHLVKRRQSQSPSFSIFNGAQHPFSSSKRLGDGSSDLERSAGESMRAVKFQTPNADLVEEESARPSRPKQKRLQPESEPTRPRPSVELSDSFDPATSSQTFTILENANGAEGSKLEVDENARKNSKITFVESP
jgi:7 transmembrane sweet-taste receptor of 3 GCPR/5'-nucleotidase, C-terminal domain